MIRSPATPDLAGNVDLVFWQVEFITIPTAFDGIELDVSTGADREALGKVAGDIPSSNLYCLRTGKQRHLIVAGGFKVLTNELDIFDSTLVYFGIDRPVEWYGKVVTQS